MKPNTLRELELRITLGQDVHTQFRRQDISSRTLVEDIVAFANTDGGRIFIGVATNGSVLGVDHPEELLLRMASIALENCRPPIMVQPYAAQIGGKKPVVVVDVPRGEARPYKTDRGAILVKMGTGKRPATTEDLRAMLQPTRYRYFDQYVLEHSSVWSFDSEAIQALVDSSLATGRHVDDVPSDTLLDRWHLTGEARSVKHPTVAGALFLAKRPLDALPHAYVSALRISGTDPSGGPSHQETITGRVSETIEDTMRFIDLHLLHPRRAAGTEPGTKEDAFTEATREILVNSVAHRDYTIADPITVIVFDDRVQIRSPGFLPHTVTLESLLIGMHVPRNPTVYNMLLKLGLARGAGDGIPRAIRLVREASGQEPRFSMEKHELVVDLPRWKRT